MIQLPNNKKCYNLPEQVAQNLLNIQYLAEQYKNIDDLPSIWADYKTAFDADLHTFEDWTTTFEGWENTLATYLANMSSAAVGAISGQNIAPANITASGPITSPSIIEDMVGYSFSKVADTPTEVTSDLIYASVVKNGNKITFVVFGKITKVSSSTVAYAHRFKFYLPDAVMAKLVPYTFGSDTDVLDVFKTLFYNTSRAHNISCACQKSTNYISFSVWEINNLEQNEEFIFRIEKTFLLSDNLLP